MSAMRQTQINLRVPKQVAADLQEIAKQERTSQIGLAQEILTEGLARRKREHALRLYQEGKATKSRASEIAGVSLWEMMELIEQTGTHNPYSLQDAVEDVRRLMQQFSVSAQSTPR